MKTENLIDILEQGENSAIEFKESSVKAEAVAKEIVGMLNYEGGVILIGISDDKKILGIESTKEEWISNISSNNINPPVHLKYQEIELEDRLIAIIEIPRGKDRPYQTNTGKIYIRVGSSNRIASQVELMILFQHSGILHYDSFEIQKASISHLNLHIVNQYFNSIGFNFDELSEF
tara:strand:- start:19703 stop:20230 length:528 start_codon:yes stop_codon:yes gene_type:complete